MADSRTASQKLIPNMQKVVDIQQKIIFFLFSAVLSFGLTYALFEPAMNHAQAYVLFLLFLAIGFRVTEAIPSPFAVGLMVFGFLTLILSDAMSHNATASILIPIGIILTFKNPVVLPLVIGLCASTALF